MAFTVTGRASTNNGTTSAATVTTSSFTPSASSLLLFGGGGQIDFAPDSRVAIGSISGGSLSWGSPIQSYENTDSVGVAASVDYTMNMAAYSAAVGGSPSSMTVAWDGMSDTKTAWYSATALDITGHNVASPIVQSAKNKMHAAGVSNGTLTVTLGSTPTVGNLVLVYFAVADDSGTGIAAPTIGGQSMTSVYNQSGAIYTVGAWYYRVMTGAESTNVITCSDLGTTVYKAGAIALEIAADSGSATATPAAIAATVSMDAVTKSSTNPYVVQWQNNAVATNDPALTFSSVATDDIIVMWCGHASTGLTLTVPAGWSNALGGTTDVETDSNQIACVYHKVTSGEAGSNVTFTVTDLYSTTAVNVVGAQVRNCDPTTPMDIAASTFNSGNTITPHVLAGLTPTTSGGLMLSAVAKDGTGSHTTPGGWTQGTTRTAAAPVMWAGSYDTYSTASTPISATNITPSAGDEYASISLVMKMAAGGATASPATIITTTSIDASTVTAGSTPAPATIITTASLDATTAAPTSFATPATIISAASVDAVTRTAGSTASPATIAAPVTIQMPITAEALFATAVSGDSRYLVDQNGDPWFGVGDTAWGLVGQLTNAEITEYLEDCASKGINLVLFSAPEYYYGDNAPNNIDGVAPFTGTAFQSTLNNTYWLRVDHAVDTAEALGITCMICPFYLGYTNTDGWGAQVAAASNAQMATYAGYLSARYGAATNIVWLMGHDRPALDATFKARGNAFADQIQTDTTHLVTAASNRVRDIASTDDFGIGSEEWASSGVSWDFDTQYDYSGHVAVNSYTMWGLSPTLPFIFFEGVYEQEVPGPLPIGDVLLREQTWAPFCAGATATIFGNNPIWAFGSTRLYTSYTGTWQDNLDYEGRTDLAAFATITAGIDGWHLTTADTGSTFVTTQGTGSNRVAARFSANLGLVYHPAFTAGTITLDLTEFSTFWTHVAVTRYDPRSGATTALGPYATSGTQNLTAPSANSAGDNDWFYVVSGDTPVPSTATPATIISAVSIDAATPSAASSSTPATIITAVSIDATATTAGSTPAPATIAVPASIDATTATAGSSATPPPITAITSMDAVTLSAGGTATPTEIVATVALDAVAASGGGNATAAPAEIVVLATLDAATISAGSSTAPATIIASAALDAATATAGSTATVSEIVLLATFDATSGSGSDSGTASPSTIIAAVVIDATTASGSVSTSPATIAASATFDAVTGSTSATSTPATLQVVAVLDAVFASAVYFAPGSIVVIVRTDNRTLAVDADNRTLVVRPQPRTLSVTADDRVVRVRPQDRTTEVEPNA